jgi:hypothetical protein
MWVAALFKAAACVLAGSVVRPNRKFPRQCRWVRVIPNAFVGWHGNFLWEPRANGRPEVGSVSSPLWPGGVWPLGRWLRWRPGPRVSRRVGRSGVVVVAGLALGSVLRLWSVLGSGSVVAWLVRRCPGSVLRCLCRPGGVSVRGVWLRFPRWCLSGVAACRVRAVVSGLGRSGRLLSRAPVLMSRPVGPDSGRARTRGRNRTKGWPRRRVRGAAFRNPETRA